MNTTTQDNPETHSFAAETARVLNLMIHALYTNRDIFLRELISNASDACDKLRYEAQQNSALLADQPELSIALSFDAVARTLTIADSGIGMSREDLIAHLGTIARSGTGEFLNNLSGDAASDVNLIGQFGVGFYSAFMVADRVAVQSRKAGSDDGWIWESQGLGSYTIAPAVAPVARGTRIILHLKDDAGEYLDKHRLGHIVSTYSDHIGFPIRLSDGEGAVQTLNEGAAIWTRSKSDITDEQYQEFYRHVAHSPETPWAVLHTRAEGALEYTSLLYVPGIKPFDLFHPERRRRVKLYVKRVFIADEGIDLVPPYLRFLRGVVDSADLPLNISRETLQASPLLEKIRDAITGKVLAELKKRAEGEDYASFWNHFGPVLKEGLCEANAPREKILDACRFYSTHGEGMISLADYISRMREGQEAIYFLTGDHLATLRTSPQLEGFKKRGIEVLLLADHVDDFWVNVTTSYQGKKLRSVVKAGADLDAFASAEEKVEEEKIEQSDATTALLAAMKTLYGERARDVRTTRKLADTPICLSVGEGDMDMRMERFLADHQQLPARMAKIVEINPAHPVIAALAAKAAAGPLDAAAEDALWLLFDQALIAEGEPVADAASFARRLGAFMARGLA
jgi:molecular chaperone HtpG